MTCELILSKESCNFKNTLARGRGKGGRGDRRTHEQQTERAAFQVQVQYSNGLSLQLAGSRLCATPLKNKRKEK